MQRQWMIWRRIVSVSVLLMLLAALPSGCATTNTAGPIVDTSCEAFKPISYSSRDTDETVDQIIGHNAAWDALCLNAPDK